MTKLVPFFISIALTQIYDLFPNFWTNNAQNLLCHGYSASNVWFAQFYPNTDSTPSTQHGHVSNLVQEAESLQHYSYPSVYFLPILSSKSDQGRSNTKEM
jgi:hypothetical protein